MRKYQKDYYVYLIWHKTFNRSRLIGDYEYWLGMSCFHFTKANLDYTENMGNLTMNS